MNRADDALPRSSAAASGTDWHTLPASEVLANLATGTNGLNEEEAERRLRQFGPNRLPEEKRKSVLARLLAQFNNLLIHVLLAAALLSVLLGHLVDAAVILAVVVVNAAIGFIQEGRAESALAAIRDMVAPRASVIRGSHRRTVPAADLVPGDYVLLEAGDKVPADLRIARARNLRLDEAILTGESVPVEKSVEPVPAESGLGDRRAMAYSGTLVAAGQGAGVVVATGTDTELGRISALMGQVETLTTPLLRQMNAFARQLTAAILAVAVVAFAFAVLVRSYAATEAFMAMVGLIVAAIPEGLPAVMTITLAIGVQRMAGRNAIIRRLPAVETLGSVSIICSDKTGTFTRNEMTVAAVVAGGRRLTVSGVGYAPTGSVRDGAAPVDPGSDPTLSELARAALLCNDAELRQTDGQWFVDGDPMEGALLAFAAKCGLDTAAERRRLPRLDEIPFDAAHRFMATLHDGDGQCAMVYVKGAPERVLEMCTTQRTPAGDEPLDQRLWSQAVEDLASEGHRVLALAARAVSDRWRTLDMEDVTGGLVLLGLAGLIDPPREEAVAALEECRTAGIKVKMITGDHGTTAQAIARQLGFDNHDRFVTGHELDRTPDEALPDLAQAVDVFARTTPEHKLRIVTALQSTGAVVAMTGDGVNDAPALKRADVGVAMGRKGTEAAKEAAELILADDNFASIVAAVREGRTVYDNLKKVIGWTLPTNGGESVAIIAAILFGVTLPMTPLQILWINMVTAVALGLTLAFEPPETDIMHRPPRRPNEPLLSGFLLWRVLFVSLLFVIGVFGIFFWSQARGQSVEEGRTLVVNVIVVLEIFYLFSVRYLHMTSLSWEGLLGTRAVLIGVALVIAAQLAFTYTPLMQTVFETRPVTFRDGVVVVLLGVVLLAVLELEKLVRRRLGLGADA